MGPGDSTDVAGLGSLGLGSRERPAWQGVESGTHGFYGVEKLSIDCFILKLRRLRFLKNTCLTYLNRWEAIQMIMKLSYDELLCQLNMYIEKLPVSADGTFKTKNIHIFRSITVIK